MQSGLIWCQDSSSASVSVCVRATISLDSGTGDSLVTARTASCDCSTHHKQIEHGDRDTAVLLSADTSYRETANIIYTLDPAPAVFL